MISVAELYDLVIASLVTIAGVAWCVFAWRSIGRSFSAARDSIVLFPAFMTVGHQVAILVLNHFRHSRSVSGPLGDNRLIDSMVTLWRAFVYVGLDVLVPMSVVLWAISLVPLVISIRTWWTASDADGPWAGVPNGIRLQHRWCMERYERTLVRQVKAYARVQAGRARTLTVERVFEPHQASTTLRITPLINMPLDVVERRPFSALRWSSNVRHETTEAATVLQVQWDLGLGEQEPVGYGAAIAASTSAVEMWPEHSRNSLHLLGSQDGHEPLSR